MQILLWHITVSVVFISITWPSAWMTHLAMNQLTKTWSLAYFLPQQLHPFLKIQFVCYTLLITYHCVLHFVNYLWLWLQAISRLSTVLTLWCGHWLDIATIFATIQCLYCTHLNDIRPCRMRALSQHSTNKQAIPLQ